MNFSKVLKQLKKGKTAQLPEMVALNSFILIINVKAIEDAINDCYGNPGSKTKCVETDSYIALRNQHGNLVPWNGNSEILREDWIIND